MDTVYCSIVMVQNIMDTGRMIYLTVMVQRYGLTNLNTKEIILKEKGKETGPIFGQINLNIKENGAITFKTVSYFILVILKGIYLWSDGRSYEGEWRDGKMFGKGRFKNKNGRSYEGDYVNDKKVFL